MAELSDKLFENWIKSGMALKYTEEVLLPFVEEVLAHHHETIYKKVLSNSIDKTGCSDCSIQNVVECYTPKICSGGAKRCTFHDIADHTKTYRQCPKNHCNRVRDKIVASHRHSPAFKNTRSEKWRDSSWELAKCFISIPWYNDKKSVREVDLTGLINIVLNNLKFMKKISANLGDENNPFSKARDARNEIMHEPNLEIPEQKLREYISILTDVLSDPKHIGGQPQARSAIRKLNELPSMEITVENKKKIRAAIHDAKDHALSELVEEREKSLQLIKEETQLGVQKIQEVTQSGLKIIQDKVSKLESNAGETKTNKIGPYKPKVETSFDKDVKRLRQHLIDLYMSAGFCKIAVPPCIHDKEVDIKDIYIEKRYVEVVEGYSTDYPIWSYLKPNALLFLSAKPGNGKSALCSKITSSWCDVHTGNHQYYHEKETIGLLKSYELLFNVPSDKIPRTSESLEELIKNAVLPFELFSAFDEVIKTKKCLIILDGLEDGYVTEECKKIRLFSLPNIRCFENNTLLVTSRQNKLETCSETSSNFKRIFPSFYTNFRSVYEKIHLLLNTIQGRNLGYQYTFGVDLNTEVPSILLVSCIAAMMYGRVRTTFSSALQIHCNLLEYILETAQEHVGDITQTDSTMVTEGKTQTDNFVLPKCLHELKCCQHYNALVSSVSKLAFNVMFKGLGRNVTMFSASVAISNGLSRKEIDFCISAGILVRCKSNSKQGPACTDVLSFPDESFQGFLAALYLHMSSDNALYYSVIQCLTSLDVVFEMANLLMLFCELKPSLMPEISRNIAALSDGDARVICYRQHAFLSATSMSSKDITLQNCQLRKAENVVHEIQKLACNCILRTLHEDHQFKFQINDFVPRKLETQEFMTNKDVMSHLDLRSIKSLDNPPTFGSQSNVLVALRIKGSDAAGASGILANSASTLKHLVVCDVFMKDISYTKAMAIASHLTSIVLERIAICHIEKKNLLHMLSKKTGLEHLKLEIHACWTCDENKVCGDVAVLDISCHSNMKSIVLNYGFFDIVYPQHPTNLEIVQLSLVKGCGLESVGNCLKNSKSIHWFSCRGLETEWSSTDMFFISKLTSLTTLWLNDIKFDQNILQLSPDMDCLREVKFENVWMTLDCLKKFMSSLPSSNKDLVITLCSLKAIPDKQYNNVVKYLQGVKKFQVKFKEGSNDGSMDVTISALSLESQ